MNIETKMMLLAESAGVEFIKKGANHYQFKGPLLVNYYPKSKSKSAYIAGTKKALQQVTPEQAVAMCFKAPTCQGVTDKRNPKASRKQRKAMLAKGINQCRWCKTPLTIDTSTVEHIIPLARGGLDNANNRTLACYDCNQDRGGNMPELNNAINH